MNRILLMDSDFGASRAKAAASLSNRLKALQGSIYWTPPEALNHSLVVSDAKPQDHGTAAAASSITHDEMKAGQC
jgi:hypothetical protein